MLKSVHRTNLYSTYLLFDLQVKLVSLTLKMFCSTYELILCQRMSMIDETNKQNNMIRHSNGLLISSIRNTRQLEIIFEIVRPT